ncbi:hypothetical protein TWF970_006303 [Orbilia oligospora]|uniref:Uncharacterized protein n=1 Tax=Orbilia oligospora TaxID=2813651 RepID=A0A7C8RE97_ORBOL|nr:hypothetical protein TWF970_006303 [Orbilia oligospora]
MSVFDCLKKNTRLPLYVPPLRWREEHLEHLRVSKTISRLELPIIPSDILEALNPIPGTPAPRSKKYVDLRWFCESAIFELLEAIGLSYKYYAQTDRHRIDLTLKRIKTPIVPDCVVYAHTNYIDQRVFVAILSSVQEIFEPRADLIYIEADCSVTLISAEFTGKYIEHVITGEGELGNNVNVKLSVLEGLSGPDSWSHYQPFLWLVKEHFEETEPIDE